MSDSTRRPADNPFSATVEVRRTVAAPPSVVWDVLTDVASWAEWCTVLRHRSGTLRLGDRPTLFLNPPAGRSYEFQPTVIASEPRRLLAWRGTTGVRGVFDGTHVIELMATAEGTEVRNAETFSGLLTPIMTRVAMDLDEVRAGFGVLNDELATRSETLAGS